MFQIGGIVNSIVNKGLLGTENCILIYITSSHPAAVKIFLMLWFALMYQGEGAWDLRPAQPWALETQGGADGLPN